MAVLRRLSFNIIIIVLAYCGYASWQAFQDHQDWAGLWWLVGGAVLLGLSVAPVQAEPRTTQGPLLSAQRWRWLVGGVLVVGSLWPLYNGYQQFAQGGTPSIVLWNTYLTGVGLWVVGLLLMSAYDRWKVPFVPILLLELLALGLWLRVYRLPIFPENIWYDEGVNVLEARRMMTQDYRPIFVANMTTPHLWLYQMALTWFGRTNITAVRGVTVLLGMGAVLMAYMVGNRLHGRTFGLWMAFFLAVSTWAVNFSRMAMTGIETVFFILLSFFFLHRLTRHAKLHDAVLLGVAVGLGLWFYSAFRTMGLALAVYWVLGWRFWKPRHLLLSVIAALTVLVISHPLALFAFKLDPTTFNARLHEVSIFYDKNLLGKSRPEAIRYSLNRHLRMFHIMGDTNGRHNLPDDPMLDPVAGALMVFGLGVALRYLRRRTAEVAFFVMVAAMSFFLGVSTIWFEAPQGLRTIGILAALAYAVALAASNLTQARTTRLLSFVAVVAVVGGMITWNYDKYFNRMAKDYQVWYGYSALEFHSVLLTQARSDHPVMINFYLTGSISSQVALDGEWPWETIPFPQSLPLAIEPNTRLSMILYPLTDQPVFEMAQRFYPNARFSVVDARYYDLQNGEFEPPLYYIIDFEPSDIAAPQGLDWDGTGFLYIRHYGDYRFWTNDVPLWLDGVLVEQGVLLRLAEGLHTVSLDGNKHPIEWAGPQIVGVQVIPDHYLFHQPIEQYGLYGRFFAGETIDDTPELERIDPYLDFYVEPVPLTRPYTVVWSAHLHIPQTGDYRLSVNQNGRIRVLLDDEVVLDTEVDNHFFELPLSLTARTYALRVEYVDEVNFSWVHLRWKTPFEPDEWRSIPPDVFSPDFGER